MKLIHQRYHNISLTEIFEEIEFPALRHLDWSFHYHKNWGGRLLCERIAFYKGKCQFRWKMHFPYEGYQHDNGPTAFGIKKLWYKMSFLIPSTLWKKICAYMPLFRKKFKWRFDVFSFGSIVKPMYFVNLVQTGKF